MAKAPWADSNVGSYRMHLVGKWLTRLRHLLGYTTANRYVTMRPWIWVKRDRWEKKLNKEWKKRNG